MDCPVVLRCNVCGCWMRVVVLWLPSVGGFVVCCGGCSCGCKEAGSSYAQEEQGGGCARGCAPLSWLVSVMPRCLRCVQLPVVVPCVPGGMLCGGSCSLLPIAPPLRRRFEQKGGARTKMCAGNGGEGDVTFAVFGCRRGTLSAVACSAYL